MRKLLKLGGWLIAAILLYLLFWPVPIDPVAWDAPEDRGFVDPYASNELLEPARGIDLGEFNGPEDATVGSDGRIYVTTDGGHILRVDNGGVSEFATVAGRPLGIETDSDGSLVIANSYIGLQRIDQAGHVTTLLDEVDGEPLVYANNLAIGPDGRIYFSQSSSKFGAERYQGTFEASLLDIMEHGGHGNVFVFDPATGSVHTLLTGLNYANGVAVSDDGSFLLVNETSSYRVLKHWLTGPRAGTTDVLLDNLPGFPDNLKAGMNGRFWLGFAAPRNRLLDALSGWPFLRKVVQRLPAFVRPAAVPASHVIAFNADGEVLMNMHDPAARFPTLTGVLETPRFLYLTTLFGNQLPVIAKQDL